MRAAAAAALLVGVAGCTFGSAPGTLTTKPSSPECDQRTSLVLDYIAGAPGEPGTPATVARAFLRTHGLRATDTVEAVTKPSEEMQRVRVVRAGKVVARVDLSRGADRNGWLVTQLDACRSLVG